MSHNPKCDYHTSVWALFVVVNSYELCLVFATILVYIIEYILIADINYTFLHFTVGGEYSKSKYSDCI